MNKLAEEIVKKKIGNINISYNVAQIFEAMQAYHEAKLKEELIKYDMETYSIIHSVETSISLVEKYLKQRNNDKGTDN